MNSHLYHLQLNIDFQNLPFYKELMTFLGWNIIFETDDVIGYQSGQVGDLWFVKSKTTEVSDFDHRGVNHTALRVENKSDVDKVADFLRIKNVLPLFETPRHRPEFADENETYYQVMFKTGDNILFEVVYVGPEK